MNFKFVILLHLLIGSSIAQLPGSSPFNNKNNLITKNAPALKIVEKAAFNAKNVIESTSVSSFVKMSTSSSVKFNVTLLTSVTPNSTEFESKFYIPIASQYIVASKMLKCEAFFCPKKMIPFYDLGENTKGIDGNAGLLIRECGAKSFLFTNQKVNYIDTWKECCNWGMIPASLESKKELLCLTDQYLNKGNLSNNLFYTAQMDVFLDRRIISCATGNLVPDEVWSSGEPNNKMKREACVAFKLENKTVGLADIRCGDYINVLCESTDLVPRYSTPIVWPSTTQKPTVKSVESMMKMILAPTSSNMKYPAITVKPWSFFTTAKYPGLTSNPSPWGFF